MSHHCIYCADQPRLRGTSHCADCGWSDLPLVDERCTSCYGWATGERLMPDYDAAANLYAAIVEQAMADKASVGRKADRVTPTFCDTPDCDRWTFVCASEYVDTVRAYAHEHDGDPEAVMLFVANIATHGDSERAAA